MPYTLRHGICRFRGRVVKRSGPLARRTPLRSTSQLARGGPLPARSSKRKAVSGERREFVAETLRRRPRCEIDLFRGQVPFEGIGPLCRGWSVDVHEIVSRARGGAIVPSQGCRPEDVAALCRPCHDYVTGHPAWSQSVGLSRHSWERPDIQDPRTNRGEPQ